MPMLSVPESTVTFSSAGWECAGILYPEGNFSRMTNGPSFPGLPARTATCAPFGSAGGAATHLMLPGSMIEYWSWAVAGSGASATRANPSDKPMRVPIRVMGASSRLIYCRHTITK